ncbi:IS30 family transposase [Patescibacteria group bacterium]|nr:IS30 family transposase [Patescibacteria group bacterium]MBU4056995.1 IS30 family transposase [Patescibacteria group bacterium]
MKNYQRLSLEEREEISRMLAQKCSFQKIAKSLNRNVSTISREVGAGSSNKYTYRASKARRRAVRNSRKRKLIPVKSKSAEEVVRAFAKEVKKLPQQMKLSMTYDQGGEMAEHKLFTNITGVKVYFAHPRSPWERGTNENTNGLIRQFFPKGTDFTKVSRAEVKKAQRLLNGRPRKTLNWQTPYEVFNQLINS